MIDPIFVVFTSVLLGISCYLELPESSPKWSGAKLSFKGAFLMCAAWLALWTKAKLNLPILSAIGYVGGIAGVLATLIGLGQQLRGRG